MKIARWLLILTVFFVAPAVCFIGCNDDDDDDDPPPATEEAAEEAEEAGAGILQIVVEGAVVIDVFDAVEVSVDGNNIGSVGWPAGGTLNYPTTVGEHTVSAQANAGTRHWNATTVDVPPEADGPAVVTRNAGNSDM